MLLSWGALGFIKANPCFYETFVNAPDYCTIIINYLLVMLPSILFQALLKLPLSEQHYSFIRKSVAVKSMVLHSVWIWPISHCDCYHHESLSALLNREQKMYFLEPLRKAWEITLPSWLSERSHSVAWDSFRGCNIPGKWGILHKGNECKLKRFNTRCLIWSQFLYDVIYGEVV